jgi:hypothetical protein
MCISNLILAIHTQSINGLEEPFALRMGWRNLSKTAEKKFSSPRAAGVCPSVRPSIRPSVIDTKTREFSHRN